MEAKSTLMNGYALLDLLVEAELLLAAHVREGNDVALIRHVKPCVSVFEGFSSQTTVTDSSSSVNRSPRSPSSPPYESILLFLRFSAVFIDFKSYYSVDSVFDARSVALCCSQHSLLCTTSPLDPPPQCFKGFLLILPFLSIF